MKEPIPVDSPEGAEALRRMNEELTQAEADGAPASPPTAPAADVFAGMVSPIPVDSPEGAEALARLKREQDEEGPARGADTSDDFFELASPAPPFPAPLLSPPNPPSHTRPFSRGRANLSRSQFAGARHAPRAP